ncbi:hypothetical protein BGX38DRAFT_1275432 [Terfezia claveryi]|nr:hypothetical protein BGX38DRAFT_1275432 [Terfezia claveryi]
MLESNPDDVPEFSREGSLDEIADAFKDSETAVLALDPVSEQTEYSITVRNHPGLSVIHYDGNVEVPDSQASDSPHSRSPEATNYIDQEIPDSQDSDLDSEMGSDNTAKPALRLLLSPTTPDEDADMIGLGSTGRTQEDSETVFQDCLELEEDTPSNPSFHQFRNEALDESSSESDSSSIKNWDSRSVLEGDRFDQMEVVIQKTMSDGISTVSDGITRLEEVSMKEREKTEEHSAILVNIANMVTEQFEAQREEMKKSLQSSATAQEEITHSYENLGKAFNEHMRAQGTELTIMMEHIRTGFEASIAAIREEGAASRVKDSEDRAQIFEAIGKIHIDAGYSPTTTTTSSPSPSSSPGWAHPAGLQSQTSALKEPTSINPFSPPFLPPDTTTNLRGLMAIISSLPTGKQYPKEDIEVIDLCTTPNTPKPTTAPSLPAGTISPEVSTDTRMSGCPALLNKGAAPLKLTDSQYADINSKLLECGGAKAPKMAPQEPTVVEPALPILPPPVKSASKVPAPITSPTTSRGTGSKSLEAGKISPKPGIDTPMKHSDKSCEEPRTTQTERVPAIAPQTIDGKVQTPKPTTPPSRKRKPKVSKTIPPSSNSTPLPQGVTIDIPKTPHGFDEGVQKIQNEIRAEAKHMLDFQAASIHLQRRSRVPPPYNPAAEGITPTEASQRKRSPLAGPQRWIETVTQKKR